MYRSRVRSLLYPAAAVAASSSSYYFASCDRDRGEIVLATAQRLKSGLKLDDLRLSETTQDGIQIYVPIGNFGRFSSEGLTVARVATTDIKCNHNDIIALWLDQSKRKDWDSSCISVLPVKASATDEANAKASQLSHFVEKSIIGVPLLIPSRDYVIEVLQPYPAALVDKDTFTALVFVNIDASKEIPRSWLYVRGKQNSILLLEPKGAHNTKVTFCIEKDPQGWALSPLLANLALGSTPVTVLRDLKKALEKEKEDKDAELSIDQIALKKFKEKLDKEKKIDSIVEDYSVARDDLRATLTLLEEKLIRVKKTESFEKIDLSDLKSRIQSDINKAKENLRQSKK